MVPQKPSPRMPGPFRPGQAGQKTAPAPEIVQDQIVLQPTAADMPPRVLHVITETKDKELRPYILVLRTSRSPLLDPQTGRAIGYAQVMVTYPAKPDPVAIAAARQQADDNRSRRETMIVQARLAAAQAAASAAAAASTEQFDMGDGAKSPGACAVLRPVGARDDGRQTTLVFDPRQPAMRLYGFTGAGSEPTVLQAMPEMRPDGWFQYVLPGTYARIGLVAENRVCVLKNKTYQRTPAPNTTGTVSPDVAVVPR